MIPTISVELPTLDRRLRCFGIRYINNDTSIEEVEDAVQKEIDGPWRYLGYKGKMLCRKKLMGHGDISATRGRLSPR